VSRVLSDRIFTVHDGARLSLEFLSAAGLPLGVCVLGPVTAAERNNWHSPIHGRDWSECWMSRPVGTRGSGMAATILARNWRLML
jgi:hypothetical protein